jgi:hypothetical protein
MEEGKANTNKIRHNPCSSPTRRYVTDLLDKEWCVDTAGDYWTRAGRKGDNNTLICFFSNGGSSVYGDDTAADYEIQEMLKPGTEIIITV